MIFNRKKATAALGNLSSYIKMFEEQFEPINTGWAIFWKGNMVKPTNGKNHYYASEAAAIQAIDRNCGFGDQVYRDVFESLYGHKITAQHYNQDPAYRKQFRLDLVWDEHIVDGKVVSYTCRNRKTITDEEWVIRNECDKEETAYEGFCRNVIKTVFVKQWIADGLLEIKKV